MEEGGMSCHVWLVSDFYILFSQKKQDTRCSSKVKADISGSLFWGPQA